MAPETLFECVFGTDFAINLRQRRPIFETNRQFYQPEARELMKTKEDMRAAVRARLRDGGTNCLSCGHVDTSHRAIQWRQFRRNRQMATRPLAQLWPPAPNPLGHMGRQRDWGLPDRLGRHALAKPPSIGSGVASLVDHGLFGCLDHILDLLHRDGQPLQLGQARAGHRQRIHEFSRQPPADLAWLVDR